MRRRPAFQPASLRTIAGSTDQLQVTPVQVLMNVQDFVQVGAVAQHPGWLAYCVNVSGFTEPLFGSPIFRSKSSSILTLSIKY